MVTVYLEHKYSAPPSPPITTTKSGRADSMSASPPNSTSVFKALSSRSYADRIRKESQSQSSYSPSTNQPTPAQSASMSSTTTATASASASASGSSKVSATTTPTDTGVQVQVDDGPWETVQAPTKKGKHDGHKEREAEKDKGSNSRNWRDRPREKAGESSKGPLSTEDKKASVGVAGTKGKKGVAPTTPASTNTTSASAPPTRANGNGKAQETSNANGSTSTSRIEQTPAVAAPAKPAWGLPAAPSKAATPATKSTESSTKSKNNSTNASTAPTSPMVNGAVHSNDETPADTPSLSTPATLSTATPAFVPSSSLAQSKKEKVEIRDTESTKEQEQPPAPTTVAAPKTAPTPKIAPPPVTNPWSRKVALASPAVITDASAPTPSESKPSARLQFGELSPTTEATESPNGHGSGEEAVKIGGKKKKKDAGLMMDANQFPDLAQAQVVGAKSEKKEVKPVEDSPEEGQTTKKPKWKAIPAAELLAAADEAAAAAAEAKQRQQRKRGTAGKQGESSTSPINKAASLTGKPRKSEGKRGDMRLPPNPNGQTPKTAYKPTFGSVEPGLEGDAVSGTGDVAYMNGHASAPMSRQASQTSKVATSPRATNGVLPTSTSDSAIPLENTIRLGAGPLKGQNQHATAPLLQQPFPQTTPGNMPRPPRGGRASFSGGRGRGGARGGRGGFSHDPNMVGFGYPAGYYGQPGFAGAQPMFDPMQAQWYNMQMYGRGPLPPPPTPQTVVPNLNTDPLRFCVLGQIEYYFSMQNLAMDFFLRQQMDTEGWISIAMIASFNRIKSLTPDVPLVKEMMQLSSLLEVQGDHVRIAGEQAKKWVLPHAKASPFPPSEYTPTPATTAAASISDDNEEESTAVSDLDCLSINGNPENAFDMKDMGFGTDVKYQPDEVKAALMKSVSVPAPAPEMEKEEVKVDGE